MEPHAPVCQHRVPGALNEVQDIREGFDIGVDEIPGPPVQPAANPVMHPRRIAWLQYIDALYDAGWND
jgi:hypothetical protein